MKIRLDYPRGVGWQKWVELPAAPRVGDFVAHGESDDDEHVVRNVIWHTGDDPWVQVVLKP